MNLRHNAGLFELRSSSTFPGPAAVFALDWWYDGVELARFWLSMAGCLVWQKATDRTGGFALRKANSVPIEVTNGDTLAFPLSSLSV